MNIATKLLLTFDIFYVLYFILVIKFCQNELDGDAEHMWSDPKYKTMCDITTWGGIIFVLQFVYYGISLIWTSHI